MISPVMPTYARAPFEFERGEGSWLIATDGSKFLDFGAGIAVNALGHAHPKLVAALEAQARRVWHVSNLYEIPEQRRLAERLVDVTFADTVFFTNSGAEAMECCIKMARKYWAHKGEPTRNRIITFKDAFHGRTLATISAAGQEKLVDGFGPLLPGFDQVEVDDIEAVKAAIGPETAAIMIEPIQGEGGIRVVPGTYLRALRQLCDEHGLLLILDEIQCGMGRTGALFAHENAGIAPDIMGVAKGIGGGFPLGACLATEEAAAGMVAGTHGSTYGGNPLACAVGNAVVEEIADPEFLDEVKRKAGLLRQRLGALADEHGDIIAEIRGEGLMLGLRLNEGFVNGDFVAAARANGLLTVPAGANVVRILPPLNISDDDLAEGVSRLDTTCRAVKAQSGEAA
ncbi:MAG: aspartate aminotransferase family protein [Paracoccaceae bacterium]|nr:aspartate aminotransferase family protein [Paracoccaceae bacterium]